MQSVEDFQTSFGLIQSLRFYVKSKLANLEVKNLPFFKQILRLWIMISVDFLHFLKAAIYQITAVLELLDSPILISRKIWMTEKSWNFQTVGVALEIFGGRRYGYGLFKSFLRVTMLQKLEKCEVKAHSVEIQEFYCHLILREIIFGGVWISVTAFFTTLETLNF